MATCGNRFVGSAVASGAIEARDSTRERTISGRRPRSRFASRVSDTLLMRRKLACSGAGHPHAGSLGGLSSTPQQYGGCPSHCDGLSFRALRLAVSTAPPPGRFTGRATESPQPDLTEGSNTLRALNEQHKSCIIPSEAVRPIELLVPKGDCCGIG